MSDRHTHTKKIGLAVGVAGLAALGVFAFIYANREPQKSPPPPVTPSADIAKQVRHFCGGCHAYPPPDTFPRFVWSEEVERGYFFFGKSNEKLTPPPFNQVVKYYEDRAPEKLPAAAIERASTAPPVCFERTDYLRPAGTMGPAISNVNLVHLSDSKRLDVLACEMRWGLVMRLKPYQEKPAWDILGKVANPARVEVVDLDGDGIQDLLVADLGGFRPSNKLCGSVVWLRGGKDGSYTPHTLLKNVGRVADVQAADFNGDGKLDLVVAVFGWQEVGEILLLENRTTDWSNPAFQPHLIEPRTGTIHVAVTDLNGDRKPDFVALISQEHETVAAFLNQDSFRFTKETIFQATHPAYGCSGMQLVDMNSDGALDVLLTNGDVLDSPHLLKPYHSVQWLENPGKGKYPFTHHHVAALYGVHRAVAADIDGDGDLDIIAVSYLPAEHFPQRAENLDAIILLEQTSPGKFARHTLEQKTCDHVTCAVGDVFGKGRMELVTGNFSLNEFSELANSLTIWTNLGAPPK
ncbi:MAG: VCBS repeat-containing protein [Gemmataceae bacterium]|nr:VCBS repeat-containing protein [Gemmataceae bacterium]MCI0738486.1 VCBS repeat-containing protein [Gemmataceae bacterium]